MRLCIVGNSHAAALKSALAVDDGVTAAHIDFFAMPGGAGPDVRVERGRLFPAPHTTDKVFCTIPGALADGLDLGYFDAVMICASGLPSHRNGSPDHVLNQLVLGSMLQDRPSRRQVVSTAVMTSVMESVLHASPNLQAISLIRSAFAGPILIQVCPLPTRALAAYRPEGEKGSDLALQYGDRVWAFLTWYYRRQINIIRAFVETLGARILPTDAEFIDAGFTPGKYGTPDPWHMNTAYGRLILKQVLTELSLLQN